MVVDIAILYAVVMWALRHRIAFPFPLSEAARIFSIAFGVQFLLYLVFSLYPIDIHVRSYIVRASIIVIALSQAIPLTVAYYAFTRTFQRAA